MSETVIAMLLLTSLCCLSACEALSDQDVQPRGKKKKIALFVFFADLIIKKIFVLKLIYAFIFWLVIHKAGYFLSWFASYLKEQKQEYGHHHHYDYGPSYGPSYRPSPNYGGYGPYRREAHVSEGI